MCEFKVQLNVYNLQELRSSAIFIRFRFKIGNLPQDHEKSGPLFLSRGSRNHVIEASRYLKGLSLGGHFLSQASNRGYIFPDTPVLRYLIFPLTYVYHCIPIYIYRYG